MQQGTHTDTCTPMRSYTLMPMCLCVCMCVWERETENEISAGCFSREAAHSKGSRMSAD